jgi:hypothetical protein
MDSQGVRGEHLTELEVPHFPHIQTRSIVALSAHQVNILTKSPVISFRFHVSPEDGGNVTPKRWYQRTNARLHNSKFHITNTEQLLIGVTICASLNCPVTYVQTSTS